MENVTRKALLKSIGNNWADLTEDPTYADGRAIDTLAKLYAELSEEELEFRSKLLEFFQGRSITIDGLDEGPKALL